MVFLLMPLVRIPGEVQLLVPSTFYFSRYLQLQSSNCPLRQSDASTRSCTSQYKTLSGIVHEFLVVYVSHVLGIDYSADDPKLTRQMGFLLLFPFRKHDAIFVYSAIPRCTHRRSRLRTLLRGTRMTYHPHTLRHGVSHDGMPALILAQHRPSSPLFIVSSCPPRPDAAAFPRAATALDSSSAVDI